MDAESHYLVASTMLAAAQSDGGLDLGEAGVMVGLLRKHFDLTHNDALSLIARAGDELAHADAMARLWAGINKKFDVSQKRELLSVILSVIAEDGAKDPGEMTFISELIDKLRIPEDAVERAFAKYFQNRRDDV